MYSLYLYEAFTSFALTFIITLPLSMMVSMLSICVLGMVRNPRFRAKVLYMVGIHTPMIRGTRLGEWLSQPYQELWDKAVLEGYLEGYRRRAPSSGRR